MTGPNQQDWLNDALLASPYVNMKGAEEYALATNPNHASVPGIR